MSPIGFVCEISSINFKNFLREFYRVWHLDFFSESSESISFLHLVFLLWGCHTLENLVIEIDYFLHKSYGSATFANL